MFFVMTIQTKTLCIIYIKKHTIILKVFISYIFFMMYYFSRFIYSASSYIFHTWDLLLISVFLIFAIFYFYISLLSLVYLYISSYLSFFVVFFTAFSVLISFFAVSIFSSFISLTTTAKPNSTSFSFLS